MTKAATSTKLPQGLSKSERLYRRDHIQHLVQHSKRIYKGKHLMLRAFHFEEEPLSPPKILISVSKRKFNRAVHRNRMKRLIREAYRHNKPHLTQDKGFWAFHWIFVGQELADYISIEAEVQRAHQAFS